MKYIKKPIQVDAEVYKRGMEDGFHDFYQFPASSKPYIQTLEGRMFISPGDYIITGIRGERYPCKPDIFEETYDEVIPQPGNSSEGLKVCLNCLRVYNPEDNDICPHCEPS